MADSLLNITKSQSELNEIAFQRLQDEGLGISAGRIAKLLVSIINELQAGFYSTLKLNHVQAFLSSATGNSLELIGEMLNCFKTDGEEEEDYRYRISQQTLTLATANETAVRLACLSVEGVEDVAMRPYTHGTGSFSVYVVTDSAQTSEEIIEAVNVKLAEFKAYGIRAEAFSPVQLNTEIKARIIFDKKVVELDRQMIRKQAEQEVKNYVNSLTVGDTMDTKFIHDTIYNTDRNIFSVEVYYFRINNRPCLWVPQESGWNERFLESSVPDAILIS